MKWCAAPIAVLVAFTACQSRAVMPGAPSPSLARAALAAPLFKTPIGTQLPDVTGLAADTKGAIYAVRWNQTHVTKIASDGTVTTLGAEAFTEPQGIAVVSGGIDTGGILVTSIKYGTRRSSSPESPMVYISAAGSVGTKMIDYKSPLKGVAVSPSAEVIYYTMPAVNAVYKNSHWQECVHLAKGHCVLGNSNFDRVAFHHEDFHSPMGVAVDPVGHLWFTEANEVTKRDRDGRVVARYSGFTHPVGIAVDGAGTAYVVDDPVIVKIAANGMKTTISAGFKGLRSIAVDPTCTSHCHIYVYEHSTETIWKLSLPS